MPDKQEFMVLKPVTYNGPDKQYNGQTVQPGVVLDFSHLTEMELDNLQGNMVLGPKSKAELNKLIKQLEKERDEKIAAIEAQQKAEKDAEEMLVAMKKAANIKQEILEGKKHV